MRGAQGAWFGLGIRLGRIDLIIIKEKSIFK